MNDICNQFPLSDMEWSALTDKFEDLTLFQSWQLLKMNAKNNHTDELEDIAQELRWSMYRAGCYYKRQVYIESCLKIVKQYVTDSVIFDIVQELEDLWKNRTKHGANKVRYGEFQQDLLEQIINTFVPETERPDKNKTLNIDTKFITYCKAITWNHKKSLGKKITREKSWRTGLTSLSEHSHLGVA